MVRTLLEDLERELQDVEYAKLYGGADAKAEFAIALAKARQSLGMTQKELAKRTGVTQPYLAKLEGGEANPTLGAIGSLLAVIGFRLAMDTKPLLPYTQASTPVSRVGGQSMSWFEEEMNCPNCGIPMKKAYGHTTFRYKDRRMEFNQEGTMIEAVPEFVCDECKIIVKQTGILC